MSTKTITAVILILLATCTVYATIEPIVQELPDLVGSYPFGGRKLASFDLGQPMPFEIGSMSLLIAGTYSSGVALIDGTEATRDNDFDAGFASEIDGGGLMDVWWTHFEPLTASFEGELVYEQIGNASWDFLLDGQADIPLVFGTTMSGLTVILQEPFAEITNATLVITPIPEPATLLLFGLGAVLLRRRGRV